MKRTIKAEIIADSIDPRGNRITSYILTYPRFIHAEVMTHRMFSRNAASSRAIPFNKMVDMVNQDPFIPIAWQKDHKGMQGTEYFKGEDAKYNEVVWMECLGDAVNSAIDLHNNGITKQLVNRLLEPFLWYTNLVTATEYDNFFELRCPKYILTDGEICYSKKDAIKFSCGNEDPVFYNKVKDYTDLDWIKESKSGAEIHIQALAEAMWDAKNESTPKELKAGDWHIPFGDRIYSEDKIEDCLRNQPNVQWVAAEGHDEELDKVALKIATARCARLSYMTFDGEIDYEADIDLHNSLGVRPYTNLKGFTFTKDDPIHASPFEHCARAMSDLEYYSFIKGKYPTGRDNSENIFNYEVYAQVIEEDSEWIGFSGENPHTKNLYGWCNNFKGFIPYRYLIEMDEKS